MRVCVCVWRVCVRVCVCVCVSGCVKCLGRVCMWVECGGVSGIIR